MTAPLQPRQDPPIALHDRAMDDLRFIRQTMQRSRSFTAVPGRGMIAVGVTGFLAAVIAAQQPTPSRWLAVWLVSAALSAGIGMGSLALKARSAQIPLRTGPGRPFLLSFLPAMTAAAALTAALSLQGSVTLLPGLWLLMFGAAVVAAGTFSIRIVPIMGITFMVVGAMALASPTGWGDVWMAGGFGGLHVLFGVLIARRHGG